MVKEQSPIPCGNPEAIAGRRLLRWQIVILQSRLKQPHYAERREPASNGDQTSFCRTLLVMLRRKAWIVIQPAGINQHHSSHIERIRLGIDAGNPASV